VLEARLDYLERIASKVACKAKPNLTKSLRQHVAQTKHSPFSRNFEELNKLREAEGKDAASDIDWIAAAFAEKFKFPVPEKKQK